MMRALALAALLLAPAAAAQTMPEGAYNPFGHSPIRIRLDLSNLTDEDRGYADEVRDAMRWWEEGGNGALQWEVRFVEVENVSDADVVLWFRDAGRVGPLCQEDERALGCARPFDRPVPIEILARLSDGTYRPYRQVNEVARHELGHALGLGHSDAPGDIMAPHSSLKSARGWRPGDAPRLLLGLGAVAVVLGAAAFVLVRSMRPTVELGEVRALSGEACAASRGGPHEFATALIERGGVEEEWLVCVRCREGAPRR